MPLRLNDPARNPFNQVSDFGIVIKINAGGSQHIGILYKVDESDARICHLVTHLDMIDELPDNTFQWLQAGLGQENRRVLIAITRRIVQRNPRIRYGLRYDGDYFAPNGDYIKRGLGKGLTCATFVLAIFRAAGIELLKVEEWPFGRPGDLEFQVSQIAYLRRHFADFIEDDEKIHIGDPRYRPDEVAAGVSSQKTPLNFAEAKRLATMITTQLKRSHTV